MKIVINTCYGGFGLSVLAKKMLIQAKGPDKITNREHEISRSDPDLVKIVEEIGAAANGMYAILKVVEIPDGVEKWFISEYNGQEVVVEGWRGRCWR